MGTDSFKIKKSLNIEPIAGASPSAEGDIVYDDTANAIKYNNGSSRTVVNTDEAQTLTNKTLSSPTISGTTTTPLTASRAVVTGASSELAASSVTATELGYVSGVTSAIQTQVDGKVAKSTFTTKGDILQTTAASTVSRLAVGTDGQALVADSASSGGIKWATVTASAPNSYSWYSTGAGHGSTNTKIRRIETSVASNGSDITYASSSTAGSSWTINTAGVYTIDYTEIAGSAGAQFGISINSAQLTTGVGSITNANRLAFVEQAITGSNLQVSATIRCAVNDVIRPHTDGTASTTTERGTNFRITRVS